MKTPHPQTLLAASLLLIAALAVAGLAVAIGSDQAPAEPQSSMLVPF